MRQGMVNSAHNSIADAPGLDVLVHPGGKGARRLMRDPYHLDWIRAQRERVPLMTSVCTGALVFAAARLLRGRPATTYWNALDELTRADSSVQLRSEARLVDDGDIVTSSGVSAGIDTALHLVARLRFRSAPARSVVPFNTTRNHRSDGPCARHGRS
jgi:transcriptional regulator GlxA family with amidase domain